MKSNTWNLFPTPVTRFTEVFTAQQLQDINQYLSTLRSGPHSAIDGDGVSSHDETNLWRFHHAVGRHFSVRIILIFFGFIDVRLFVDCLY